MLIRISIISTNETGNEWKYVINKEKDNKKLNSEKIKKVKKY